MSNTEIIQEPKELNEEFQGCLNLHKELMEKRGRATFLVENESKKMDNNVAELKEHGLEILDVPDFLNKSIPEKERVIKEFKSELEIAADYYEANFS